jgi:hypothetical protein
MIFLDKQSQTMLILKGNLFDLSYGSGGQSAYKKNPDFFG